MTKIPYLDAMWSVTTGCGDDMVSLGCQNCYARRMFGRNLWKEPCPDCDGSGSLGQAHDGREISCETCGGHEDALGSGKVPQDFTPTFHADRLDQPLHWRKPRRIGVSFMGDWAHPALSDSQVMNIFGVMLAAPQHEYLYLTKRPERQKHLLQLAHDSSSAFRDGKVRTWAGATVCNQAEADHNVPLLLDTPAAARWVSCEPLLSAVDLSRYLKGGTDCDRSRGCISDRTSVGHVLNRHKRSDLETHENGGRKSCEHAVYEGPRGSTPRRDRTVSRPLAGAVRDPRGTEVGLRPSRRLDGGESSRDSEWSGDQPQGRRPLEQRAGKSGAGDSEGEHSARWPNPAPSRDEGTERRGECLCEGDRGRRAPHSGVVGSTDHDAAADVRSIRAQAADDQQHREPQELGARGVGIDLVVLGGETGPGARPMQPEWALDVYRQCKAAGVPFWFKQGGAWQDRVQTEFRTHDAEWLEMVATHELLAVAP